MDKLRTLHHDNVANTPKSTRPVLNVSKSNSFKKAQKIAQKPQPNRERSTKKPQPRNFIQENIAKAAQKSAKARTVSASTSASSLVASVAHLSGKPTAKHRPNIAKAGNDSPRAVLSNAAAIFGRNPFGVSATDNAQISSKPCANNADQNGQRNKSSSGSDELEIADIQRRIAQLMPQLETPTKSGDANDRMVAELEDETMRLVAQVDRCGDRLAGLRLDGVEAELEEIVALHNGMESERVIGREADEARLASDWQQFDELMQSLEIEED